METLDFYIFLDECFCGWEYAMIACEEEVGPTIDVFCTSVQVQDVIKTFESNVWT